MSTFNVMGPAQKVSDLIEHFKSANGSRILVEVFPTKPDLRDVDIELPDERADELYDWCDDHGLECELV